MASPFVQFSETNFQVCGGRCWPFAQSLAIVHTPLRAVQRLLLYCVRVDRFTFLQSDAKCACCEIALWDYFAASASANDSFVAGVGGGGYVFLNTLTSPQFKRYAQRVGRLLNDYGPRVVDTYGFAGPALLANYSAEAALGGVAPSAYISEPTHFGIWDEIPGKPILPYALCSPQRCPLHSVLAVGGSLLSDGLH